MQHNSHQVTLQSKIIEHNTTHHNTTTLPYAAQNNTMQQCNATQHNAIQCHTTSHHKAVQCNNTINAAQNTTDQQTSQFDNTMQ